MAPSPQPTEHPLVSVIVPVYKVEEYLPRCLESIAAQTYPNLDVILVDDGSPDACGGMCDRFAQDHANVRVLHQTNQGQAAARNNAVPRARGDWIAFIDSDDYVEPDYIEYLMSLAEKFGADIVAGGFAYEYEGTPPKLPSAQPEETAMTPVEMVRRMNYGQGFGTFPWGKLYRKDLVLAHPYPAGKIYEDLATTCKIVGDARQTAFGGKQIYHWLQRPGSTMSGRFNERQLDGLDAAREQLDYIAARIPEALASAKFRHAAKGIELAGSLFGTGGDRAVWKRIRAHVLEHGREVLHDPRARMTMKLRILAVMAGHCPAKWVFRLHAWGKRRVL